MAVQPWGQQGSGGGGVPPVAVPSGGLPHTAMRASHADRDRTVDVLKAAFAEGRLTPDEYSQRFDLASQAQTYGELARVVADLPAGPMVAPAVLPPPPVAVMPMVPVVPATFLPPPPLPRRTNGAAVTALVLGVLTFTSGGLTGIPAVIFGHKAKQQLRERDEEGDGMANVGLVLGYLSVAGWALLLMGLLFLGV